MAAHSPVSPLGLPGKPGLFPQWSTPLKAWSWNGHHVSPTALVKTSPKASPRGHSCPKERRCCMGRQEWEEWMAIFAKLCIRTMTLGAVRAGPPRRNGFCCIRWTAQVPQGHGLQYRKLFPHFQHLNSQPSEQHDMAAGEMQVVGTHSLGFESFPDFC